MSDNILEGIPQTEAEKDLKDILGWHMNKGYLTYDEALDLWEDKKLGFEWLNSESVKHPDDE